MKNQKIPCTCPCHKGGRSYHIKACCHNGLIALSTGDYMPEPLSPLADKMLEAIFVKTGGRAENPKIAKLCAAIAEEHYLKKTNELIYVYADEYGYVNCPFCKGVHRHGGNGNGIAEGERAPDCGNNKKYFVVPEHKWPK